MRKCVRCGRRLRKSEKLEMCEGCRKETLKKFLASVLPDVEAYRKKRRKPTWNLIQEAFLKAYYKLKSLQLSLSHRQPRWKL